MKQKRMAIIALVLAVVSITIQLVNRFRKTKYKDIQQDVFIEGDLYVSKSVTAYITLEEFEEKLSNRNK